MTRRKSKSAKVVDARFCVRNGLGPSVTAVTLRGESFWIFNANWKSIITFDDGKKYIAGASRNYITDGASSPENLTVSKRQMFEAGCIHDALYALPLLASKYVDHPSDFNWGDDMLAHFTRRNCDRAFEILASEKEDGSELAYAAVRIFGRRAYGGDSNKKSARKLLAQADKRGDKIAPRLRNAINSNTADRIILAPCK